MNSQRQDILNILQSRGPLYTRELFDIMQDTHGYYGNVTAADGCERLSKVLWDMKAKGQLHSRKDNTHEGPKAQWGLQEFAFPDDEPHQEMASDVAELADISNIKSASFFTHIPVSVKLRDHERNTMYLERINDGLFVNGNLVIKTYDEFQEFTDAIERMLP